MNKAEINNLILNGKPGAASITQLIDGKLITRWAPALDDIFITTGGELERFGTPEEATARAEEIQAEF